MQFTQYILNTLRAPDGEVEIRINRNNTNYEVEEGESLKLFSRYRVFQSMGGIKKSVNDEEGFITCDQVQINLQDIWAFAGKSNTGNTEFETWDDPYTENAPDGGSFLNHVFFDETALYTVYISIIKPDATKEILFAGDVNPLSIPREDQFIDNPDTVNEKQLQSVQLTLNNVSQRLKTLTIQQFLNGTSSLGYTVPAITQTEVGDTAGNMAGLIPSDNGPYMIASNYTEFIADPFWDDYIANANWFVPAYYGHYNNMDSLSFPMGHYCITFGDILTRIAKVCNFSFNPATDLTSAFLFWKPIYASNGFTNSSDVPSPKDIKVSYNYTFGIAPIDGSTISSPVTYAPTASLSEVVKDIALQLGCYVTTEWDAGQKRIRLKVLSRRTSVGSLPTKWKQVKRGKEEPRSISKRGVKITVKGVQGEAVCPAGETDVVNIDLRWRTKLWGGPGPTGETYPQEAFILNKDKGIHDQDLSIRVEQGGKHNPDSWILASFLYASADYDGSSKSKAYPTSFNIGASNTALMWYVHRNLSFQRCTNPYFGPAQFYAHELLGNKIVYNREYYGVTDDTGSFNGIKINMQHSFKIRGVVRLFRAVEMEIDVFARKTKIKWLEIPSDYEDLEDYSFAFVSDGKVNGGGSSSATGTSSANNFTPSGSATVNPLHLVKNPKVTGDNTIKTTVAGDVVSLRIEKGASQTGNLMEIRDSSGTNIMLVAHTGGTYYYQPVFINALLTATSVAVQSGHFSTALTTVSSTDASSDITVATVDYVKAKFNSVDLSGYVKKTPTTESEVTIIPGTNNIASLVLQPKSTSTATADTLKINDKTGTNKITLQSDGAANFASTVTVNNIVTKGTNIMSTIGDATVLRLKNSSTQSLPIVEFLDNATNATLMQINGVNGEVYSRQGSFYGPNNSAAGGYTNRGIVTIYMSSSYNSGKGLVLVGHASQSSNLIEYRDNNNTSYFSVNKDSTNGLRMRLGTGSATTQVSIQDDLQFDPGNIQLSGTALTWNDNSATGKSYVRFTTSGGTGHTLTSFSGGTDGKVLYIVNATGGNLILANQAATGTAANRIITGSGANITLAADQCAHLLYDGTTSRWRLIARS